MNTNARMPATAAYEAIEAEVFPVEAQATLSMPSRRAAVAPAVIPRSLKEAVGFSPSCLRRTRSIPVY